MTLGYFIYIVSASSVIINWLQTDLDGFILQKINLPFLDALIFWESTAEIPSQDFTALHIFYSL